MTIFRKKQIFIGCAAVVCALVIAWPAGDIFNSLDNAVQNLMTRMRGESRIDSSIAIVYFNNDDIESLGGYPLKRSYYALLIKALKELNVGAIGIDVGFSKPDERYPEYDNLLGSAMEGKTDVVLGGYFRRIDKTAETDDIDTDLTPFLFAPISGDDWLNASEAQFPFSDIRMRSDGLGHTNLGDKASIPVFVKYGSGFMPSFGFEVLRHGLGISKSSVNRRDKKIMLENDIRKVEIPLGKDGSAEVNFAGGKNALNLYRALDVLQAYDAAIDEKSSAKDRNGWKGKFVLVGIIAEGRSTFINTPFDEGFPSIGMHAMFIHNGLQSNFIKRIPYIYTYIISLAAGIISVLLISMRRARAGSAAVFCIAIGLMIVSNLLFVTGSWILPVALPVFTLFIAGIALWAYKHRYIRDEIDVLTREKSRVEEVLQEKEMKLLSLEQELSNVREEKDNGNQARLREEIERYKGEIDRLKEEAGDLQESASNAPATGGGKRLTEGIVYGGGGPMVQVMEMVKTVADSDATVLLLGESGTGKELIARALHNCSRRKDYAFVAVNCGALTETLLESELFGHEKGAFTGAMKEREGRFDLADKGTIFLDEIGDTSEAFQVKILRVLQDGTFERVGGNHMRRVDVRVIAATNRDLRKAVKEKSFREDLFYRLNVISIEIPPLRDRKGDLPFLVDHFLNLESPGMTCSVSVMHAFRQYGWRGNVRELHSVIKRAVLLAKADGRTMLRMKDLPGILSSREGSSEDLEEQIISALRAKKFSRSAISETAQTLGGLNRGTVAEYFRGYCFKVISESDMNIRTAAEKITRLSDADINNKVERKLREYLSNAMEMVDPSVPLEDILLRSRPKYKNLPQRYHSYLDQIITSAHQGKMIK